MANTLSKEIAKLRKAKNLSQEEVANKLGIPRSSFAKKEQEGDFSADEIPALVKIIGGNKDYLIELAKQRESISIENWKEFLIKNAINSAATQRVLLMALAEVLAFQKKESVTKILSELTAAVEGEKRLNSMK